MPSPGVRLLRIWRGDAHSVLVLDDGFEYRGQRYRSLSQIAAIITGTHWSGPRFFGQIKSAGQVRRAAAKEPVAAAGVASGIVPASDPVTDGDGEC
jgi:hypothetical protein